eukprot:TRINITY_DN9463_c0_g1_i3.p1 TRINITY_DN9463_c0_g1~~TRINITY_DN9463_c0_g1_i3.p1  ORF type:complete len:1425 (+),score=236.42 TRINITY_DN9463_c0_g1_i3:55-4329(+)
MLGQLTEPRYVSLAPELLQSLCTQLKKKRILVNEVEMHQQSTRTNEGLRTVIRLPFCFGFVSLSHSRARNDIESSRRCSCVVACQYIANAGFTVDYSGYFDPLSTAIEPSSISIDPAVIHKSLDTHPTLTAIHTLEALILPILFEHGFIDDFDILVMDPEQKDAVGSTKSRISSRILSEQNPTQVFAATITLQNQTVVVWPEEVPSRISMSERINMVAYCLCEYLFNYLSEIGLGESLQIQIPHGPPYHTFSETKKTRQRPTLTSTTSSTRPSNRDRDTHTEDSQDPISHKGVATSRRKQTIRLNHPSESWLQSMMRTHELLSELVRSFYLSIYEMESDGLFSLSKKQWPYNLKHPNTLICTQTPIAEDDEEEVELLVLIPYYTQAAIINIPCGHLQSEVDRIVLALHAAYDFLLKKESWLANRLPTIKLSTLSPDYSIESLDNYIIEKPRSADIPRMQTTLQSQKKHHVQSDTGNHIKQENGFPLDACIHDQALANRHFAKWISQLNDEGWLCSEFLRPYASDDCMIPIHVSKDGPQHKPTFKAWCDIPFVDRNVFIMPTIDCHQLKEAKRLLSLAACQYLQKQEFPFLSTHGFDPMKWVNVPSLLMDPLLSDLVLEIDTQGSEIERDDISWPRFREYLLDESALVQAEEVYNSNDQHSPSEPRTKQGEMESKMDSMPNLLSNFWQQLHGLGLLMRTEGLEEEYTSNLNPTYTIKQGGPPHASTFHATINLQLATDPVIVILCQSYRKKKDARKRVALAACQYLLDRYPELRVDVGENPHNLPLEQSQVIPWIENSNDDHTTDMIAFDQKAPPISKMMDLAREYRTKYNIFRVSIDPAYEHLSMQSELGKRFQGFVVISPCDLSPLQIGIQARNELVSVSIEPFGQMELEGELKRKLEQAFLFFSLCCLPPQSPVIKRYIDIHTFFLPHYAESPDEGFGIENILELRKISFCMPFRKCFSNYVDVYDYLGDFRFKGKKCNTLFGRLHEKIIQENFPLVDYESWARKVHVVRTLSDGADDEHSWTYPSSRASSYGAARETRIRDDDDVSSTETYLPELDWNIENLDSGRVVSVLQKVPTAGFFNAHYQWKASNRSVDESHMTYNPDDESSFLLLVDKHQPVATLAKLPNLNLYRDWDSKLESFTTCAESDLGSDLYSCPIEYLVFTNISMEAYHYAYLVPKMIDIIEDDISFIHESSKLEEKLGLQMNDRLLFRTAFTTPSYASKLCGMCNSNSSYIQSQFSYERLEFLGDSVLDYSILVSLLHDFEHNSLTSLFRKRSTLVNNKNLLQVSDILQLKKLLIDDASGQQLSGKRKSHGDIVESFIGAIYLDLGLSVAHTFCSDYIYDGSHSPPNELLKSAPFSHFLLEEHVCRQMFQHIGDQLQLDLNREIECLGIVLCVSIPAVESLMYLTHATGHLLGWIFYV